LVIIAFVIICRQFSDDVDTHGTFVCPFKMDCVGAVFALMQFGCWMKPLDGIVGEEPKRVLE
jgi:hypothetical protein